MPTLTSWPYKRIVAVAFVVGVFMDVLDVTIVNVALPTIGDKFGASATGLEWVVTGYLLSLAVWIPASGWLGDRVGTKRVFLFALGMFTLGSALCGLSWSIEALIAFRVVQGIGGGMLVPVGTAMLYRAYPPSERARASSVLTIPSVLGPALGPVLGGVITTHTSWRFIFLINVPIGIAAFVFGVLYLQEGKEPTAGKFDVPGFALSATGFGLVIFGLSEVPRRGWTAALSIVPTAAGLVVVAILILYELRQSSPMLAFRLYANRAFRSANIVGFIGMGAFIGSVFVLPLFLQLYRGLSPQESGLTTFTQALGFIAIARYVGIAYMRLGPRRLMVAGLLFSALINLNFLWVDEHTNLWWIRLIMFGRGLCLPLLFIPLQASAFASITMADTGRASSLFSTQRQVASAVGVAILGAILFTGIRTKTAAAAAAGATGEGLKKAQLDAYHRSFLWVVIFYAVGAVAALFVRDADAAATMGPRSERA
ncbi:MAG: MDR family MFS transporter [Acidimicrobiales bacterium]